MLFQYHFNFIQSKLVFRREANRPFGSVPPPSFCFRFISVILRYSSLFWGYAIWLHSGICSRRKCLCSPLQILADFNTLLFYSSITLESSTSFRNMTECRVFKKYLPFFQTSELPITQTVFDFPWWFELSRVDCFLRLILTYVWWFTVKKWPFLTVKFKAVWRVTVNLIQTLF